VVQEGDEGNTIDVVATSTNDNGATISATSAATLTVLDKAPTISPVTLSGTLVAGQTLTANGGVQSESDDPVTYVWSRSSNGGATWTAITGATGSTYKLSLADEHDLVQVVATVTNDDGVKASTAAVQTTATIAAALPTVGVTALELKEDGHAALGITLSGANYDPAQTTVTISGLAAGSSIKDGLDSTTFSGASVTLTAAEVASGLTLYAGEDAPATMLQVYASNTFTGDQSATQNLSLTIDAVPEAPNLTVIGTTSTAAVSGEQGSAIGNTGSTSLSGEAATPLALGISISGYDADDGNLSLTISGLPSGAKLTNTHGDTLTIASGGITFTQAQLTAGVLNGLSIAGQPGTANLTITATNAEAGGASTVVHETVTMTFPAPTVAAQGNGYWAQHETASVWKTTDVTGKLAETFSASDNYNSSMTAANLAKASGVLLGDVQGSAGAAGPVSLFISSAAAAQLINSSDTAIDARQILAKAAIAAQLNIENGVKDAGSLSASSGQDLVGLATQWLEGKMPFIYVGSSGNVTTITADGILESGATGTAGIEYNTTTKAFTSTAQVASGNEWNLAVDTGVANPLTGHDFMMSGQDIKNALQAFNQNQLVVSSDGKLVGWDASGAVGATPTFVHQNDASGALAVLVSAGIIHG
jgi:hypothetical protein